MFKNPSVANYLILPVLYKVEYNFNTHTHKYYTGIHYTALYTQ